MKPLTILTNKAFLSPVNKANRTIPTFCTVRQIIFRLNERSTRVIMAIRRSICRTIIATGHKTYGQSKGNKAGLNRNHFKKIYVHRIYPREQVCILAPCVKYNLIYRPLPVPLSPNKY